MVTEMVRMTATEVSRHFSSVINRVDSGEEIEIVRNGRAIAELRRPSQPVGTSGAALRALMDSLPPLDADFAREVERERELLGAETGEWPES
jgi:antitoxin (DNA-binding transcriptional repressor) of toxin-antitoxin stability system